MMLYTNIFQNILLCPLYFLLFFIMEFPTLSSSPLPTLLQVSQIYKKCVCPHTHIHTHSFLVEIPKLTAFTSFLVSRVYFYAISAILFKVHFLIQHFSSWNQRGHLGWLVSYTTGFKITFKLEYQAVPKYFHTNNLGLMLS